MPPSLRLGLQSDVLGMMTCDLGASDHIHNVSGLQVDKSNSLLVNLPTVGKVQEISEGLNAQLGFNPISEENYVSIKSIDSDNDYVHDPHLSVSKGFSKSKRRQPKPI